MGRTPVKPLSALLLCLGLQLAACWRAESAAFGPPVQCGAIEKKKLKEISGAVAGRRSPGVLWVHNDGSKARLFALSTNGQMLATFKLNADVTDAEDIAAGPGPEQDLNYLYLGDIGDNDSRRRSVRVYRFPEPLLDRTDTSEEERTITDLDVFSLVYPDRPYDAEALMVDPLSGDLWIVTKQKKRSRIFRAAKDDLKAGATTRLSFVAETPFAAVSGGDVSPDGTEIILRREDAAALWRRVPGEDLRATFARPPVTVPVIGPPTEPNGESIAFAPDGSGYYTLSEGKKEPIYFFPRRTVGSVE